MVNKFVVWAMTHGGSIAIVLPRGESVKLTAIIEAEGDGYVLLCPELDIASQGDTIAEARENLREALELFFETPSRDEIKQRRCVGR